MNNKFIAKEAKILVYGYDQDYMLSDCNNQEQVNYAVERFGEPMSYMDGFKTWREVAVAKRCYEWLFSAFPHKPEPDIKPTKEEIEWWELKVYTDEHDWNPEKARKLREKYDAMLPDKPTKFPILI